MDGTIVFIFLLDHLPGDILNESFETVEVTHTNYSSPDTCNYEITNPLLQRISKELEVLMIPKWLIDESNQTNTITVINSTKQINSHETVLNTNKLVESSLEEIKTTTNSNKIDDYERFSVKNVNEKKKYSEITVKAPFLAAIFESLSNITAQTCGGTVIASQWVLTAASCINLLSNMHAETTKIAEKGVYTVIVNASDPLIDGSAHNVTDIRLHPRDLTGQKAQIALMKIEPAIEKVEIPVFGKLEEGGFVIVYGWSIKKTNSDFDTMVQTAFKAIILEPSDCSTYYKIAEDTSEMCLATNDEYAENINQLSWGGPVLTKSGGILAVTRGDGLAPLAAWPLASHLAWIHDTAIYDRH